MKQRIISALIMLPLLVFVYIGGIPFFIICACIAEVGMYEFYHGYEQIDIHPNKTLGCVLTLLMYIIVFYGEFFSSKALVYSHLLLLWVFLSVCTGLCITLLKPDHNILDGPITSLGVFYIGFFVVHAVLIDRLPRYSEIVWLVFLSAFGADIFAYFVGCAIGKRKLCPTISPKKTVEGAIGGVIGSTLLCGLFGYICFKELIIHCLIIGFLGSFFAMTGDLVASAFKRKMGIKDYGNLIPGHGGILDRFDSVLFVAPFVYYYTIIFIKP